MNKEKYIYKSIVLQQFYRFNLFARILVRVTSIRNGRGEFH